MLNSSKSIKELILEIKDNILHVANLHDSLPFLDAIPYQILILAIK